jgi:hypothetical protein
MARVAKPIKNATSATTGRKPGRVAAAATKTPVKAKRSVAAPKRSTASAEAPNGRKLERLAKKAVAPKALGKATTTAKIPTRAPAARPAPAVSKDELRAQVEKLELLVATLRAKSRETNRAAKAATARIAELEDQVAKLE